MPGIVGIISQRAPVECEGFVRSMVASMQHESFYVSGTYSAPEIGVYGGWVAHEESFAAGQVFTSERRDIALLFAGECFFDPGSEASAEPTEGDDVNSRTHWLIRRYTREGEHFVDRLNGLFCGLLIDKRRRKVFLFNDRFGLERLYWHESNGSVYFASEAKALLRVLPNLRDFDLEGVAQFVTYGCTLEERTVFRGVSALAGGSLWSFADGKSYKSKYFSVDNWESQPVLAPDAFEANFQETFKRVLPRYFATESKLGISLTGGLDTRMIMACRPETEKEPVCYTFSGERGLTLDDRLAARVAKTCGLDHRLLRIGPDFLSEFPRHADRTVYLTDGCFGVLGTHEIYLNQQARGIAPVRLTGNYGGEIFRKICTLQALGVSRKLGSQRLRESGQHSWEQGIGANTHPVTFGAFREVPWNLFGSLMAGRSQVRFRTPYLDNELVALAYQAPAEFCRSRDFGLRLVRKNSADLGKIPTDKGDLGMSGGLVRILRSGFSKATFKLDYLNTEGFPHWLLPLDPLVQRVTSDMGIGGLHKYLHYRRWFRGELAAYVSDTLSAAGKQGLWNSDFLQSMAFEHTRGRKNYVLEINAVLTLEAVERLFFRELPLGTNDVVQAVTRSTREELVGGR